MIETSVSAKHQKYIFEFNKKLLICLSFLSVDNQEILNKLKVFCKSINIFDKCC